MNLEPVEHRLHLWGQLASSIIKPATRTMGSDMRYWLCA